jgi:hypothetical protein
VAHVASTLWPQEKKPYYPFLSKLADTGRPLNELVAMVLGLAIGSSVDYAQGKQVRSPCNGSNLTGYDSCCPSDRSLPR